MGFVFPFLFIFGVAWLLINVWILHREQKEAAGAYVDAAKKCIEHIKLL